MGIFMDPDARDDLYGVGLEGTDIYYIVHL